MRTHTAWAVFIPSVVVTVAFILGAARGPFYVLGHADPAYQYLFSSLAILDFTPPRHTDHPGTTLQLLGAGVIALKWLWASMHSSVQGLEVHVLSNSESYIKAINHVLILLIGLTLFFSGRRLLRHTQSWVAMMLLQVTPFFFLESIIALYNNSPEPLLIAVVYGLIFLLIPFVAPIKPMSLENERRSAWALGLIFGFGMATKVTFFPLLLSVFFLRRWKDRFLTAGVTLSSFIFFTAPIIPRYKFMIKWNLTVLKHSGQYGSGTVGLPSAGTLIDNAALLWHQAPMFFILLGIYMVAYMHLRFGHPVQSECKQRIQFSTGLGIAILLIQLLITIKHPLDRYLLPCMIYSGFVSALLAHYYVNEFVPRSVVALTGQGVLAASFLAIGFTSNVAWGYMVNLTHEHQASRAIQRLTQNNHCIPMSAYKSVYKNFAFWFADNWNAKRLGPTLQQLRSDGLFYEPTNDSFHNYEGPLSRQDVQAILDKGQCIYFQTTRRDFFDKKLVLEPVSTEDAVASLPLYELKGFQDETDTKR